VTLTGPWGHSGAYSDLRSMVAHMANPLAGLTTWNHEQVKVVGISYPEHHFDAYYDPTIFANTAAANELPPVALSSAEIDDLMVFLESLTDRTVLKRTKMIPLKVPSGKRDLISLLPDILFDGQEGLDIGNVAPFLFDDRLLLDDPFFQGLFD
jgi:cytochrome c peroxidase